MIHNIKVERNKFTVNTIVYLLRKNFNLALQNALENSSIFEITIILQTYFEIKRKF